MEMGLSLLLNIKQKSARMDDCHGVYMEKHYAASFSVEKTSTNMQPSAKPTIWKTGRMIRTVNENEKGNGPLLE